MQTNNNGNNNGGTGGEIVFPFSQAIEQLSWRLQLLASTYQKEFSELTTLNSRSIAGSDGNEMSGWFLFDVEYQENLYLILHYILSFDSSMTIQKHRGNIVLFNKHRFIQLSPLPNFQMRFGFRSIEGFSESDLDMIIGCYSFANDLEQFNRKRNMVDEELEDIKEFVATSNKPPLKNKPSKKSTKQIQTPEDAIKELRIMGLAVFEGDNSLDWDDLSGCEKQKADIKKIIYNRIAKQSIYEEIIKKTRKKPNPRMPKGVLLYGPGGVGKTLTAKIMASTLGVPLVVMKKSEIDSKWVNEGNENISKVFRLCEIIGTVVLFIDELEQLGLKRGGSNSHYSDELVSTLLAEIDGIASHGKTIILAATNMKDAIDPPLLQRFTKFIEYTNPDFETRKGLFSLYAHHLSESDREILATNTDGMSGRSIEYCCEATESSLLEKINPDSVTDDSGIPLPVVDDYLEEIKDRKSNGETIPVIGFGAKTKQLYS